MGEPPHHASTANSVHHAAYTHAENFNRHMGKVIAAALSCRWQDLLPVHVSVVGAVLLSYHFMRQGTVHVTVTTHGDDRKYLEM